jgi:two-component system OmpR family response regulator
MTSMPPTLARTPRILLVEDDREISKLVTRFLGANGFRVDAADNGRAADRILEGARIDLIVLDLMLPGEDGLSMCRRLRVACEIPILILSAKAEDVDRILGLEMGADDYLAKPFNARELLARVKAVLRRSAARTNEAEDQAPAATYIFQGWQLHTVFRNLFSPEGVKVSVTPAEFYLLVALCQRPRRVLSRDRLIDLTQGRTAGPFERSIDVLVSRLRQKLERDPRDPLLIQTVRSGGYMFTPEVARQ